MAVKIKLKPGWTTTEEITQRLLHQFKTDSSDLEGIEFVYDSSYDIIVFFNYVSEDIKPNTKAYLFPHEPTWTGSHQKSACFDNLTLFGYEKSIYYCPENVIELPAHTFYGGRGPWCDSLEDWTYLKSEEYKTTPKTKVISSVVTTLDESRGSGPTCLYKQRHNIINSIIEEFIFIDYYGGWLVGNQSKTEPRKLPATLPYRFSLSIENEYQKNWISEKFYDPIVCNTVPIYYGCSNIKELYPEDGYILIEDINNISYIKELLTYIYTNHEEVYKQKLPGLLKIKERYFREFNLLKKIKKLALNN